MQTGVHKHLEPRFRFGVQLSLALLGGPLLNLDVDKKTAASATDVDVFDYLEPRDFLCAVMQEKKGRSPSISLRAWSRQLGFATPSYLSAVLNGTRRFKPELGKRIAENLRLSETATKRLELLILRKNARQKSQFELYDRLLSASAGTQHQKRVEMDRFHLIFDWYHLVLLEMISLPGFHPDANYLSRRLGGLVMPQLIETALQRLVRLKLAKRTKDGRLVRTNGEVIFGDALPDEKVRSHHQQFLEKAKRALHEQPLSERDFRGSAFVLDKTKVDKARKIIKDAHQALRALAREGTPTDVYHFSSQLFCLTYGGLH